MLIILRFIDARVCVYHIFAEEQDPLPFIYTGTPAARTDTSLYRKFRLTSMYRCICITIYIESRSKVAIAINYRPISKPAPISGNNYKPDYRCSSAND